MRSKKADFGFSRLLIGFDDEEAEITIVSRQHDDTVFLPREQIVDLYYLLREHINHGIAEKKCRE